MPEPRRQLMLPVRLVICCGMAALLGGCAQFENWLHRADQDGMPATEDYLHDMYRLAGGDPLTQAEILAEAETAAAETADPSMQLRLALVLAMPGHAATDAERAQVLLRELLSRSELLTPAEISLATIHLSDVEHRLALNRETARLRAESSQNAGDEQRAIERRLAGVEAENRELRKSLAEAEQKLEAITTIERSMRQQSGNDDSQLH